MRYYKTYCKYAYSLLGEKPTPLDSNADYIVISKSDYFPHCVIIQKANTQTNDKELNLIVPENSIY